MRVYYTELTHPLSNFDFKRYLSLMSPSIQQKVNSFKNWQDSHTSLIGKLLLLTALEDIGYQKIELLTLTYNKYGKPFVSEEIDFNISHSETLVMCVVSEVGSIGVDVEVVKPIKKKDFYNCWTPNEAKEINRNPYDYRTFYNYWTKKEAIVKAIGNGLNILLTDIEINGNKAAVVDHGNWYLKEIPFSEKYIAHFATKEPYNYPVTLIQKQF